MARFKFNRRIIIPVLGLVIVAAVAWWQITLSSAGTPVNVVTIANDDIEIYVSAPAKVSLPGRADLNFKAGGRIDEVNVKKGDEVVAGEVLATIDMASIYPQINQAEAGLKIAKAGLDKLLSGRSRREIAVAEASVNQASAAITNARRNLKSVKRLIEQSKKKASLNVDNAAIGVDSASHQLSKLKNGPRGQEIKLARFQRDQAEQAYKDAKENYSKVENLNEQILDESDQSEESAEDLYEHQQDVYDDAEEMYESTPTADNEAAYNAAKVAYLQAKAGYEGALAARQRVIASNAQSKKGAETQLNAAESAYSTALMQYEVATAGVRSEDLAIAQDQLKQAQIALEIAKIGSDDASLDTQLDAAQAQLDTAISSSKVAIAQLDLQNEGARAEDVRSAKGQIEQAQAALASAELVADDAVIKAPFSGKVASVNGKPGEIAGMNPAGGVGALITLINSDHIELTADIDETEISKLKDGQDVNVMLDAYEDKVFDGKLTYISLISSKNSTGGTVFGVTVIVNPGKDVFREGMSGDVDVIVGSKKNVLAAPFDVVKFDGKKSFVYVIKDGISHKRYVKTGLASDTMYEIQSGLKKGESVAVGKVELTDGQQVKVEKDKRAGR